MGLRAIFRAFPVIDKKAVICDNLPYEHIRNPVERRMRIEETAIGRPGEKPIRILCRNGASCLILFLVFYDSLAGARYESMMPIFILSIY